MPNTDPPLEARKPRAGTTAKTKTTATKKPTATQSASTPVSEAAVSSQAVDDSPVLTEMDGFAESAALPEPTESTETEAPTESEASEVSAASEESTESDEPTSDTSQTAVPVDPFNYHESIVTVSFSFLPPSETAAGRQVVVSVRSRHANSKPVMPDFMTLSEADVTLPMPVLELIERYRTVSLPKRKAEAEAKAAALAAKRPVTGKKGKDIRPEHVVPAVASKRAATATVKTQLKLNFAKGTAK